MQIRQTPVETEERILHQIVHLRPLPDPRYEPCAQHGIEQSDDRLERRFVAVPRLPDECGVYGTVPGQIGIPGRCGQNGEAKQQTEDKDTPESQVIEFLAGHSELWVSTIVLHELEFGLLLLPKGRRRKNLRAMLADFIETYANRILPVAYEEGQWAAKFRADARRCGRVLHLGDALIAGTARAHDLAIATRNTGNFNGLDVETVNPWKERLYPGERSV